jgi:capsular exopolysaccharide synthesis family protein
VFVERRDFVEVIRARKWLIVLPTVIVTVGVVAISLLQPSAYQGVAQVLVAQPNTGIAVLGTPQPQLSYQPDRDVQTQLDVIQSRRIVERVIETLGLNTTVDSLLSRVRASTGTGTNGTGTNVISIRVTDASAAGAARIADSFAEAYVAWSRDSQRVSIKAAADDVERRLAQAQEQIVAIEATSSAPGTSGASQVRLEAARTLYATLADKLEQLRIAEQLATGTGSVLSSAAVDPARVSPSPGRDGALGLALGFVFGLGMALLMEYLDDTIKSSNEAEKVYGGPVLGNVPAEEFEKGEKRRLSMVVHPGGPAAEAYRVLRNNLNFVNFQNDIKTLLVTSSVPGEGKSTVAANLATALTHAGMKVVLVNGDFRRPVTGEFFAVNNTIGLSDVLLGRSGVSAALQQLGGGLPLVLNSGQPPPNQIELLGSEKMAELIKCLREWFDFIIIDSPPLLAAADASALVRWADGVLMVAHGGVSSRQAGKAGREMLEKVGARMLGVVVWGLKDGRVGGGHASYAYQGHYASEPADQG